MKTLDRCASLEVTHKHVLVLLISILSLFLSPVLSSPNRLSSFAAKLVTARVITRVSSPIPDWRRSSAHTRIVRVHFVLQRVKYTCTHSASRTLVHCERKASKHLIDERRRQPQTEWMTAPSTQKLSTAAGIKTQERWSWQCFHFLPFWK